MRRINPANKNGKITKVFIRPQDAYLVEEVQILFPNEYVEVYTMEEFTCDWSELFCYDNMYVQDLPAVIVCESERELSVLEVFKNFDT